MIKDYIKMAVESFTHRKMRSWLTMVGIFIGITAVIAIISLGQGLESAVFDEFNELGSDKIWIQPGTSSFGGTSSAATLTDRDLKVIERTTGVSEAIGMSFQSSQIEFKDEIHFALVTGYEVRSGDQLWEELYGGYMEFGRWHDPGDTFKAVIGYDYTQEDKVFPQSVQLFDTILIKDQPFKVIGVMEKIGNSADDQNIFIPDDAYTQLFGIRLQDDYKYLVAKVDAGEDPFVVAADLEKNLRNDRGLDEGDEDFTAQTTEELVDSFNSILIIVQVVIIGIAAISLVIGGIGIMNTMYTAVVERTKEIGIMKAIGARNSDILTIFLIESGLLGLAGGVVGVIIGLGLAKGVEIFGAQVLGTNLLKAWWSWELIAGALAFAFIVGMLSGFLPALQAAKQQAVDSLRYE